MEESVLIGDFNVYYRKEGEGEPLVLLHGMSFSHEVWDLTIKEASRLFTVYAPDLPGFGRSDKPAAQYGLSFYTGFIKKFLDVLDIGQCALVGTDLGGEVAAAFAAAYPDRVGRLVLVSAKGFSPLMAGLRTLRVLGSPLYLLTFRSRDMLKEFMEGMLYDKRVLGDDLVEREWARMRDPAYRRSLSGNAQYLSAVDPGLPDTLKSIKARTLIVWGKEDALLPAGDAYRFSEYIANSKVQVLERCGHVPAIERNGEFNRALLTFLAEVDVYYDDGPE